MRSTVRFLLGQSPRELERPPPTMTVLEYLRLHEHRTGTKEGCAEGDCGACTVVVGKPGPAGMSYLAVNSCIQFVPTLDGCQLLTVEDLQGADGRLHPVQQALVEQHGSQCGFCTPGIVMSLWALWRSRIPPTPDRVDAALAGNLCRCTGYGPIAAAARSLAPEAVAPDPSVAFESEAAAWLRRCETGASLAYERDGQRFLAPRSADELAAMLLAHPDATIAVSVKRRIDDVKCSASTLRAREN